MKSLLLFGLLLVLGLARPALAQTPIDTTGGRYFRPIFPTVTVTSGVAYGSAVTFTGGTQTLLMDIYQPVGDATAERPVIIFAHQGGFVTGSRSESYMASVCTQFAKLGYVTASIDYRLGFFPLDTTNFSKAALRGMQDLRAAVRFFRKDAATTNTYRISPSRIVVGGTSAGGFAAIEVGYLDKASEVPADVNIALMDGIEGASGNPGYSSAVLAVLNLSGATNPPSIIEAGNAPLYSAHGTSDAVVPYFKGKVNVSPLPPKYVFGSGLLNPYASSVGVLNVLRRFSKAPHIPQYPVQSANAGSPNSAAYADTTYRDIRAFLRPLLGPFALPSLTINSNTTVPGGNYQDITINSGTATLAGNITVYGTLVIKSLSGQLAGSLGTNCFVVDGPGNFDLQAGASLRICDAAGISASGSTGAIRNTGSRSFSPGAVYAYVGTGNQATGAGLPGTVRELEVAVPAGSTLTLSQTLSISQRLLPTSGTFDNSAGLTLLSGPAGTALATPGAGTLTTALAVQRYIDPSVNPGLGYRHLAAPVTGATVGGLNNTANGGSFAPEISQAATYNNSATPGTTSPFPNIFFYDQSRVTRANAYAPFDRGYEAPTSLSDQLLPGRGYTVNMSAGQTLSFSGTLTSNNAAFSATLPGAVSADGGWHLLGNPFASALNWDAVPVPAGLDGAMYIFVSSSQYGGNYRSYVNGVGGAPGSTIPLGQAFFVRSPGATPVTLTFPTAARITDFATANAATVQRPAADPRARLRLTLAPEAAPTTTDEAFVYLETGATAGPDARYDARKLANPSGLNLASTAAGQDLSINGLPLLTATTVVPLTVAVPQPGRYTLAAADLQNFAPGTSLTLTDALAGTRTVLAPGSSYSFALAGTTAPGRFALELRPGTATATAAAQLAEQVQLYPNPAVGSFRVVLPATGATAVTARLSNALGQVVRQRQLATPAGQPLTADFDVRGLAPGVYQLHLAVGGTAVVRRVVVQ
ncbi:carboxylesterase family protein [Hymenobacter sp. DH14]|uniref:Carboxylesterase family protein n=1 Tax=Hymenobacter cyanobacteriorum TaxID=2926463 RepID=A0A9X2AKW0_9BACT|nr:carboxylesterase family protein [Hymenobacter cyanobacteriorum]MCI1190149.1 carboxylesterase family protein [Hymenobacter cyanobacteriorum]